MKGCLRTLLAVCVLATNFPQMFCCCGLGAAAAKGSGDATACPRCFAKLGRTAPPDNSIPPPCCCQKCKAIQRCRPPRRPGADIKPCAESRNPLSRWPTLPGEPLALGHLPFGRGLADSPNESSGLGCAGDSFRPSADLIAIRFFRSIPLRRARAFSRERSARHFARVAQEQLSFRGVP